MYSRGKFHHLVDNLLISQLPGASEVKDDGGQYDHERNLCTLKGPTPTTESSDSNGVSTTTTFFFAPFICRAIHRRHGVHNALKRSLDLLHGAQQGLDLEVLQHVLGLRINHSLERGRLGTDGPARPVGVIVERIASEQDRPLRDGRGAEQLGDGLEPLGARQAGDRRADGVRGEIIAFAERGGPIDLVVLFCRLTFVLSCVGSSGMCLGGR